MILDFIKLDEDSDLCISFDKNTYRLCLLKYNKYFEIEDEFFIKDFKNKNYLSKYINKTYRLNYK